MNGGRHAHARWGKAVALAACPWEQSGSVVDHRKIAYARTAIMAKRIFMTVAEVSGDQHAAALARALFAMEPGMVVEGIGGSAMKAAGVVIHHETVNRATMFLRAVLRAVEMWKLLRWTKSRPGGHPRTACNCTSSRCRAPSTRTEIPKRSTGRSLRGCGSIRVPRDWAGASRCARRRMWR